jgi:plasmid maintenance system antidote protein VapI
MSDEWQAVKDCLFQVINDQNERELSGEIRADGQKVRFVKALSGDFKNFANDLDCVKTFRRDIVQSVVAHTQARKTITAASIPVDNERIGIAENLPEMLAASVRLGAPATIIVDILNVASSCFTTEKSGYLLEAIEKLEDSGHMPDETQPESPPTGDDNSDAAAAAAAPGDAAAAAEQLTPPEPLPHEKPFTELKKRVRTATVSLLKSAPSDAKTALRASIASLKIYNEILDEVLTCETVPVLPTDVLPTPADDRAPFGECWKNLEGVSPDSFTLVVGDARKSADRVVFAVAGGHFRRLINIGFSEAQNNTALVNLEEVPTAAFFRLFEAALRPNETTERLRADKPVLDAMGLEKAVEYWLRELPPVGGEADPEIAPGSIFNPLLAAAGEIVTANITPETSFDVYHAATQMGVQDKRTLAIEQMRQAITGPGAPGLIDAVVRQDDELSELQRELARSNRKAAAVQEELDDVHQQLSKLQRALESLEQQSKREAGAARPLVVENDRGE